MCLSHSRENVSRKELDRESTKTEPIWTAVPSVPEEAALWAEAMGAVIDAKFCMSCARNSGGANRSKDKAVSLIFSKTAEFGEPRCPLPL